MSNSVTIDFVVNLVSCAGDTIAFVHVVFRNTDSIDRIFFVAKIIIPYARFCVLEPGPCELKRFGRVNVILYAKDISVGRMKVEKNPDVLTAGIELIQQLLDEQRFGLLEWTPVPVQVSTTEIVSPVTANDTIGIEQWHGDDIKALSKLFGQL